MIASAESFTVPAPLIYALIPTTLVAVTSLVAYLFRQNARSNEALARTAQELKDIGRRTARLEDAVFPVQWNHRGEE